MYNEKVNDLLKEVKDLFKDVNTKKELEDIKNNYMGKNGKRNT